MIMFIIILDDNTTYCVICIYVDTGSRKAWCIVLPTLSPHHIPTRIPLNTFPMFYFVLTFLAHLFFFTLRPHTPQATSIWLYIFFFH